MYPAPSQAPDLPASVVAAQDDLSEVFGNISEFWGFTRTQGRVFGLLFLSRRPLGQREIRHRLDISAGSASMTLASLVRWGALHRRGRQYEAETDLWKVITGVLRRREREQVDDAITRVEHALATLRGNADPTRDPDLQFAQARLSHLLQFFRLGRSFLEAFVGRKAVHNLIDTLARRAANFPFSLSWKHDVRVGT